MNFKWTMERIVQRGYIDKIVENLPMNEKVAEGVRRLRGYVEQVISGK